MKKYYFILAAAALSFASCSNDETIESAALSESNEIGFRPLISGVTRASSTADVTTENLASFTVNAMMAGTTTSYFSDEYTGTSGGEYTSTTPHYWPATESLDFYAYTPAGNAQVTYTDYKTFTVTPTTGTNPANQVDLVYAATKNKNKESQGASGVTLNFRHTGAKIVCNVINSSTTLKFGVDGWKVGYLNPQGTFVFADANTDGQNTGAGTTLSFAQWTPGGTKAYSVEYASTFTKKDIAVSSASATKLDGDFILIPQRITAATAYANSGSAAAGDKLNNTFIAVQLYALDNASSTLIAGGGTTASPTTIWAIWPIGDDGGATPFNWEPGKKYTYTIDLAGCGYYETNQDTNADLDPILENAVIKFVSVTVDNWTDDAEAVPGS